MSHFAEPVAATKDFVTYKRADDEPVGGEYAFVCDVEYFEEDDDSDYFEVIKETWTLVSSEVIKFGPTSRSCDECEDDVTLLEPFDGPVFCPLHDPKGM